MRALLPVVLFLFTNFGYAQSRSVFLEDLSWLQVPDAMADGKTTAIYCAGSTEQNGPHMALGKHNFSAHYVPGVLLRNLGKQWSTRFYPSPQPAIVQRRLVT